MKTINSRLLLIIAFISIVTVLKSANPVYQFNFTAKPVSPSPIRWEDAIATYTEPGITKFAAAGVNSNVLQTVASGLGLTVTADQKYILIKAKTTSADQEVSLYTRIGRYYNVWGDTCIRYSKFVPGGDWQTLRFNIDKAGFALDKWYHIEFRTCHGFDVNWSAYGDFYFDELAVGGDILSGGTLVVPSLRETNSPTAVTSNSAVSGGNVTYDGGSTITERGICWSTTTGPTVSLTTKAIDAGTTGAFSCNLTGLTPNTLYYVRSYATNSSGTCYGTQVTFTTSADVASALDNKVENRARIYPNPANDVLNISGAENNNVLEVFNALGKSCLRVKNRSQINIGGLPKGTYYIKISNNSKVLNLPFVKN